MTPFTQKIVHVFNLLTMMILTLLCALFILVFKMQTEPLPGCATKDEPMPALGCMPTPTFTNGEQALYNYGKSLFNNNCQQCHSSGADVIVGPGLKGVLNRRSIDWLITWVQNSQKVIASGDPYAVKLYNKYNKTMMQSFTLTTSEVKAILFYVTNYGSSKVVYIDSLHTPENKKD
ncbi:cytochrome c [uncultured Microscilla sp.]|uniref:c-type cytochrome n=1 Tax=uncultured Microscilla sp. TaxID=432653 RepID=UPI002621335D|nr:cytochrome c [uncultured Microscilla sp.]